MTFWKRRYAAGARLIAVPGWPLPTFWTESIASMRVVSTARRSRSVHSRGVVTFGILSMGCSRLCPRSARANQPLIPPADRTRWGLRDPTRGALAHTTGGVVQRPAARAHSNCGLDSVRLSHLRTPEDVLTAVDPRVNPAA